MKQVPTSNFPVKADPLAAWNDEVPWDLFDGAFSVRLNLSVPLVFVPFVGVEFLDPAAELPRRLLDTPADYEQLARELEAISDHRSRAGQPLSQLAGQQIMRLLAETIIPALPEDDRYWLTDR